jgi:hypothetical protein
MENAMHNTIRGMVVTFALGSLLATAWAAEEPTARPSEHAVRNSLGTWKLNLKESIAPQGRTFNPYTVVVRRADEVLDFTYYGSHDGKAYEFHFTAKADGTVHELEGGIKAAMVRLPSGNYEARMWLPDGSFENKFCQMAAGGKQQICLATLTEPDGSVVFFKQVQDRQ